MKKIILVLFLSVIIIALNSPVLADENIKSSEEINHTEFDKYDAYSSDGKSDFSLDNKEEKEVYDLIYKAFMELSRSLDLSEYSMTSEEVFSIRNKVLYDYPEIFYLDYEKSPYYSNGKLDFGYLYTNENVIEKREQLNDKVKEILNEIIIPDMTEFQKELAIHDYIVLNTRYDQENLDNNTVPKDSYNTYGTLTKGVAVCQGYAETFKLLLREVGIDSIIVSSPGMNHAWNIVNIDGENYQVDVTWNDPIPDRKGKTSYKYLNLTDNQMSDDHKWNQTKYPSSTNSKYSNLWEIDSIVIGNNHKYYTSLENMFIYRLDEDFNKEKITSVRAPYFDIAGEYIYFSNYDDSGYLYKIKKNGIRIPLKLNNEHSVNIYREGDYIYYTEENSGMEKKINIDIEAAEVDSESLYKRILDFIKDQVERIIGKLDQ